MTGLVPHANPSEIVDPWDQVVGAQTRVLVWPRHRLRESLLLKLFLGAPPGRVVLNAGAGQGSFSARHDR
jgi:hypothetical protein